MQRRLFYAGIGSQKTPVDVCETMVHIGAELAKRGWTLRSGHADGADLAFELGAISHGAKEIYLPWPGFNGAQPNPRAGYIVPEITLAHAKLAAQFHPNWSACSQGAKKLHVRNVCQILGLNLYTPATMVVCWTKGARGLGGTGQALRIAEHYDIPIFDLADPTRWDALAEFVTKKEAI